MKKNYIKDCLRWLSREFNALTDEVLQLTPSQWSESKRYLPKQVTPMPGFYDFAVAPYLREIVDALGQDSPVRQVVFMKGVQIGATVGILENIIGYGIDHLRTSPFMMVTADQELAKIRLETNIKPMIAHSGLGHLIQATEEGNKRKTGSTDKKIEWRGGGYLLPFGAKNGDKVRSISVQYLLLDEVDAFPILSGKDGDNLKSAIDRTAAYEASRKILLISTPLIKGSSQIQKAYLAGDQRKYMVACKGCDELHQLVFHGVNKETGLVYGLIWKLTEKGQLDFKSVRYVCKNCGHEHVNADKSYMMSPKNGAKWVATAVSNSPVNRSYHLNALYSPAGMQSWETSVLKWFDAWDIKENKVRDIGALQNFYNNVLGEPFEVIGSKVQFAQVSAHRRTAYTLGTIPNEYAEKVTGSKILFLTCAVDVHKSNLAVSVIGWTRDQRCFVIDYWRFDVKEDEDDCSEITSPVWGRLRSLIEEKVYDSDDGRQYGIVSTLIDAGWSNDTVSNFCSDYQSGVTPILGRDRTAKNQKIAEFAEFKTQAGQIGYRILVDHYKERLAPVLRREWREEQGDQPTYHFNAPVDISDKALKELTVESKREKIDPLTGLSTHYWHRPQGVKNELWDLLVYSHAAVEILAYRICIQEFELETIDWFEFWQYAESKENDALFSRFI